jgi:tol-pal system protein YbgF
VKIDEIKRKAFRKSDQAFRLGMTGIVLSFSVSAVPCNADESVSTTDDANAYRVIQLLNQNEELLSEIAKLRGQVEVLVQGAEQSGKSQRSIAADFDSRLGKIEAKPDLDTSEDKAKINAMESRMLQLEEALAAMHEVVSSTERARVETNPADSAYETALQTYRDGDYEAAVREFRLFLDQYSSNAAAPNARYWLAEALLRQNDYGTAIEMGEILISTHPDSDKIPDTIFLLGKAHLAMGDSLAARDTWETLVADYADTDAAKKARDLLDRLP